MKLIKPSYLIIKQDLGLEGVYKAVELAGRTCYKSEDKITFDSANAFVDRMIKSKHLSMLEHGTVYLRTNLSNDGYKYCNNKFSKVNTNKRSNIKERKLYITTNLRVLVENNWLNDLQFLCKPSKYHEKRHTVKFICDRGVSHEFVRHRVFSFAQESTRFCNYSKDKFENELTFIIPSWMNIPEGRYDASANQLIQLGLINVYELDFIDALICAEHTYMNLLSKYENRIVDRRFSTGFKYNPWTPQQARNILPNALKTELVMTGFESDWIHFFNLRANGTTGAPHPQAKQLAEPLMQELLNPKYTF